MLSKLVSFDTVSTKTNLPLIEFVSDYLKSHKIHPNIIYNENKTKANLYAEIGSSVPGGIILSGHTDVVPVEGQDWHTNPFTLTETDSKLYGRGSCDMKGFNAIVLGAVPKMIKANLKRPLQIALSYDEEIGCIGAPSMIRQLSSKLPKAEVAIVGEPTMMKVVNAHKTSIGLETLVKGFEVHSSIMHKGVSAIMISAKLISWLEERNSENMEIKPTKKDKYFDPPFTTLHVGLIKGGTAGNITSKNCQFTIDIRCLPSESGSNWVEQYKMFAKSIEQDMQKINKNTKISIQQNHLVPGLKSEKNGIAEQIACQLTGKNGTSVVSYGTEAGQFQEAGYSTIICGPGSIEQAHQANEYLSLEQLSLGENFIENLINKLS
jgi:acetylornithine deacetylase